MGSSRRSALLALLVSVLPACATPPEGDPPVPFDGALDADPDAEVEAVLDALHRAASEADGATYFGLFHPGAIYYGTDASERWTLDDFRAFAEPYFSKGRGWTYEATERNVFVAAGGDTAWFDERLWNEKYGETRGTGVLLRDDAGWRIAQYNLSFPVPNDLAGDLVQRIRAANAEGNGGE